jgi:hypothetical protein
MMRIGELTLVFSFPAGSVTVMILVTHDPSRSHPVAVAVHKVVPDHVIGFGVQLNHGTLTVAPGSMSLRFRVTV